MKDNRVEAYYVGKLFDPDPEDEFEPDFFFCANVTGHRKKNGKVYETRDWDLTDDIDEAKQFPIDKYTVSQVQAIIKVTGLARRWVDQGCRIDVVLVRVTTEITTVGENANPLIQLAMLAPEE
jgi:hypothetical protein